MENILILKSIDHSVFFEHLQYVRHDDTEIKETIHVLKEFTG